MRAHKPQGLARRLVSYSTALSDNRAGSADFKQIPNFRSTTDAVFSTKLPNLWVRILVYLNLHASYLTFTRWYKGFNNAEKIAFWTSFAVLIITAYGFDKIWLSFAILTVAITLLADLSRRK